MKNAPKASTAPSSSARTLRSASKSGYTLSFQNSPTKSDTANLDDPCNSSSKKRYQVAEPDWYWAYDVEMDGND